jgi:hypothetical protein
MKEIFEEFLNYRILYDEAKQQALSKGYNFKIFLDNIELESNEKISFQKNQSGMYIPVFSTDIKELNQDLNQGVFDEAIEISKEKSKIKS